MLIFSRNFYGNCRQFSIVGWHTLRETAMLTVRHLNRSFAAHRSGRWKSWRCLTRLCVTSVKRTVLAPPALKKDASAGQVSRLSKIAVWYCGIGHHGIFAGRHLRQYGTLLLPRMRREKQHHRFWLHYAEGSLMPLLLMRPLFTFLGKPAGTLLLGLRTLWRYR